jgi:lysozyme family protein
MITSLPVQDALWTFIAGQESGTLSLDPKDRGNWTSGIAGIGKLRGSKWGISAAAFPDIDITNVTFEQAKSICMTHYWPAVHAQAACDLGAPAIAMVLTDAAWGSGPIPAIEALQRALGVDADGDWGAITDAAFHQALVAPPLWGLASGQHCLLADFIAERVLYESQADTWKRYAGGWVHRLARIESLAHTFLPAAPVPVAA